MFVAACAVYAGGGGGDATQYKSRVCRLQKEQGGVGTTCPRVPRTVRFMPAWLINSTSFHSETPLFIQ